MTDSVTFKYRNHQHRPAFISPAECFQELFKSAEIANFTAAERRKYRKDMLDEQSIIQSQRFHERKGREEGIAIGIQQGVEQGASSERQRITEVLRSAGVSEEIISKL